MKRSIAHTRLSRRGLLSSIPAGLLCTLGSPAFGSESAGAPSDDCFGVYRLANDHFIGIERFATDRGELIPLFADYKTSAVRRLFPASETEFVIGPNMGARDPVEATIVFEKDRAGNAQGMVIRRSDVSDAHASKLATREEEVSFQQGDARLAGRLIIPPGHGPHAAIILLHGSGPLGRHSFGPYPRFFSSLGLAVLTFDKRGVGASTGRRVDANSASSETLWDTHYPDDLVRDALAAHRHLQQRPEIDPHRVGLWGSSEGGMLTTQAAARDRDVAFAINSSGFVGPLWETLRWQTGAIMRANNAPDAEIAEAEAFTQLWMHVARTGRGYDEYLRAREAVIARDADWPTYHALQFTSLAQMRWAWRRILSFDSLPAIRRVRCPTLGVFGEKDVLTNAEVAPAAMLRALEAGGNRDATTRVFANASHSLMDATTRAGMAPGVFDTLRTWLVAHT